MMKDYINKEIEITKRSVSDKVQPHFAVGARFTVVDVSYNDDEVTAVIVKHPTRNGKTLRCSAARFAWRIVTQQSEAKKHIAGADTMQNVETSTIVTKPLIPAHVFRPQAPVLTDMQTFVRSGVQQMLKTETPQQVIQNIERIQAEALVRKAEHDKCVLHEALSEDAAFSLAYVPFVIAEVAWNYVDTLLCLVRIERRQDTKKLCRVIKQLRADYDRERFKIIDKKMRDNELESVEKFFDNKEMSDFFNGCFKVFNASLTAQYGEAKGDSHWIVSTAYVTHIVLQALFRFIQAQEKCVKTILGYDIEVLPEELHTLGTMILDFAGNMTLKTDEDKEKIAQSINELAEAITNITANITND